MIHVPVMVHLEPAVGFVNLVTCPIERCAWEMLLHSTARRRDKNLLKNPGRLQKERAPQTAPRFRLEGANIEAE
jgi:hypothetical protein